VQMAKSDSEAQRKSSLSDCTWLENEFRSFNLEALKFLMHFREPGAHFILTHTHIFFIFLIYIFFLFLYTHFFFLFFLSLSHIFLLFLSHQIFLFAPLEL
jgi:hypothetical protein